MKERFQTKDLMNQDTREKELLLRGAYVTWQFVKGVTTSTDYFAFARSNLQKL
jgi:hypothetical protein